MNKIIELAKTILKLPTIKLLIVLLFLSAIAFMWFNYKEIMQEDIKIISQDTTRVVQ